LVATDIAARGIDVDELEFVINFEMSNIAETYVHRIGRTGRAGAKGTAISFCDAEEKAFLRDVERLISKRIEVIDDHLYPMMDFHPEKIVSQQGRRQNAGHSRPRPAANHAAPSRRTSGENSNRRPSGDNPARRTESPSRRTSNEAPKRQFEIKKATR